MKDATSSPPPTELWPDLAAAWTSLPAAARRARIDALARAAREAWQAKVDLRDIPLAAWGLRMAADGGWTAMLPPGLAPALKRPLPPAGVRAVMADWINETRPVARAGEQMRFLRQLLPDVGAEALRYQARAIAELADRLRRDEATVAFEEFEGDARNLPRDIVLGKGPEGTTRRPEDLLAEIEGAFGDSSAHTIKAGRSISVVRTYLWDQQVIIKRFALAPGWRSLRHRGRPSRARRAWAAGRLLRARGIATPDPLGFVEVRRHGIPVVSYAVARFVDEADSAFRWIRRRYRGLSSDERSSVAGELRRALLELYAAGIYHGDTKLTNLLIVETDGSRKWLWTDLDCVDAGGRLTRRRLLRNLVQLNGSLRRWVPDADRLAFLAALALRFPWLARPRVAARIAARSRRRLRRELDGRTPPDGRRGP